MAQPKIHFACQSCGYQAPKWLGKCPDCGSWNSFLEEKEEIGEGARYYTPSQGAAPVPITEIGSGSERRISTGLLELDRVLGGGVVPGAVILVGGDPGIGKSTLLLQASGAIAELAGPVLYISGEESAVQTKMRGQRLGCLHKSLYIMQENSLEEIFKALKKLAPSLIVIDSVQAMYTGRLPSAAGSISQIREVAAQLINHSKRAEVPCAIIGHVTKDGAIAGPKVLEHMVDTVLYFEADLGYSHRILRAVKNRFGSTNEIGVFEMGPSGFEEIKNPSEIFLSGRPMGVPGSVAVSTLEGTRPMFVEVQALVGPSSLGMPRRVATGIDYNRALLLVAILEKRCGLELGRCDIFLNVAGGIRLSEPAAELGTAAAIASSYKDIAVESKIIFIGEVGLGGEVRAVGQPELRLKEASKLGFEKCAVPRANAIKAHWARDLTIIEVSDLNEMLGIIF